MVATLIDTHIHLDFEVYDLDRAEVIARSRAAGVERIISVGAGGGIASTRRALSLAEQYPEVYASVGVHPQDAAQEIDREEIRRLASHPRVVAIGETGLDFFRDFAPRDKQYEWFEWQIALAREIKKPLIIHSRDAGEDSLRTLRDHGGGEVRGVYHCYSEDAAFAVRLREIGFLVSFTGVVTFKKADALRQIIRDIPLDQIMLETDGPYMAPEPYRGKRAESAHVVEMARVVASVKGVSFEEVCRVTTATAENLFNLQGDTK